ncbi:biotin/lipoate--protein ligase family protein [Arenibaculum pallidiluteum]|uniref:biotin/lipoate--protein ligase family protein n=1 Tax=Arenibaculum pallidiluteum TaxID=2812559 RepID=UPI001A97BF4D|nr:biotin/lipoate--protein ligase family protein [Arenibaculum pallidiluteum]
MALPELSIPPVYESVAIAGSGAFSAACARAEEIGAGALFWSRRTDRLDCAVVLEPEQPRREALTVLYAGALALREAIGALGPPNKPVTFAWPDRIDVDGACVGGVRLAAGADRDGVPAWLVLGAEIEVTGDPDDPDPGRHVGRTALWEEGFGEVEVPELTGCWARFLLGWITRFTEEGFAPVRREWLARTPGLGRQVTRLIGGSQIAGLFRDMDETGAMVLADGRRFGLELVLDGPTWRL